MDELDSSARTQVEERSEDDTRTGSESPANKKSKHSYNSQMYNYEMIEDMKIELTLEIENCKNQIGVLTSALRDKIVRLSRTETKTCVNLGAVCSLEMQCSSIAYARAMYIIKLREKEQQLLGLRSYVLT
ncbi:hypothetical protein EB796_000689 [Bugula neritina]|uniref:Uncharacterized protein n=1 Tax=Bugula neritina TaxID=10212 RepID=A0A7J7KS22_BUGNE|nr:hypothetical protein EB796_000689 [Bugula neritina]